VSSAAVISGLAFLAATASSVPGLWADVLAYGLYASIALCVFFIHLYIGRFKRFLVNLYFISLVGLVALLFVGKGSVSAALAQTPSSALLLLPLSGCLGFVTAKEAFCFKLIEGYLLAMIMPLYLLLVSGGILAGRSAFSGLVLISVLLVLFTVRKVITPMAWDIGDKSAYH
jgi:uncharacterized integral membrane protein